MKKPLTIILILIALLLLIGQDGCRFRRATDRVKVDRYHTGTDGLVINFVDNAPPFRIYDNNKMKIVLELRNRGTCDIGPSSPYCFGFVQIEGFDPTIFTGFGGFLGFLLYENVYSKEIPDIPGQSVFNPDGGYDVVSFPSQDMDISLNLPDNVDRYTPTILAKACYRYKTDASAIVCVDPDPYGVNLEEKVCTIRDETLTGGQGAPVAVTRVEEEVITTAGGNKYLQFKIFVRNVGDGGRTSKTGKGITPSRGLVVHYDRVFSEGSIGCARVDYTNKNKVFVTGDLSGIPFINCRPEGFGDYLGGILLDETGVGFVLCNVNMPATQNAYTAPLHIQLYYGYISSVHTTVEVIQTPGEP